MADYGQRESNNRTGGPGTAAITNDDEFILDIPEKVDDSEFDYSKVKDPRSY